MYLTDFPGLHHRLMVSTSGNYQEGRFLFPVCPSWDFFRRPFQFREYLRNANYRLLKHIKKFSHPEEEMKWKWAGQYSKARSHRLKASNGDMRLMERTEKIRKARNEIYGH